MKWQHLSLSRSGREHNAGGQRGWSLWRSHTGRMNNEHTLFSQWAGSAPQTIGPSLSSSTMSDNDHIQPQPPSSSLLTYMSIKCDSRDERGRFAQCAKVCVDLDKRIHVAYFPQQLLDALDIRNTPFFFYMLCCRNVSGTSADPHRNREKKCTVCCYFVLQEPAASLPSCLSVGQIQWIPPPRLSRRSEYKYELRLALLSDEWSCQPNSASFQSRVLPLIPHSRSAGSCENWKWQSNQHVEQADWTKLSWPRSELFNTSGRQRLPLSEHAASLSAFQNQENTREKRRGKKRGERGIKCEFSSNGSQKWSLFPFNLWSTRAISKKESFAWGKFEANQKPTSGNSPHLPLLSPPRQTENVCITCFAADLMSRWHCQMKDTSLFFFSPLRPSIPRQFIFGFICSVAWGSVRGNQLAVSHSDDNKSRHYHFYSGSIFETEGGRRVFVRVEE